MLKAIIYILVIIYFLVKGIMWTMSTETEPMSKKIKYLIGMSGFSIAFGVLHVLYIFPELPNKLLIYVIILIVATLIWIGKLYPKFRGIPYTMILAGVYYIFANSLFLGIVFGVLYIL